MTVIAWDGNTLAADKMALRGDSSFQTTKIAALDTGELLAWTGRQEYGQLLLRWYTAGADPEKWPAFQRTDDWSRLILVTKVGVLFWFEQEPIAQKLEGGFAAFGSGADFALGALRAGMDARMAVQIASELCISCGLGVDCYEWKHVASRARADNGENGS